MREVKFRGKRAGSAEWIYGYYCFNGWTSKQKHYIIPDYASTFYGIEVAPETVGQCIGLKDKNGTEIYKGDICVDARGFKFVVEWDDDNARFIGRGGDYIRYVGQEPAVVVVGNIFDNSEPLEEPK